MIWVLFICFLLLKGVFGAEDTVKTVSGMEGDSLTLNTDVTQIQKADLILWIFGPESTRIAQINRQVNMVSLFSNALDGRFRDRLHLDDQTGDLTIMNIRTEHSGLYELQIYSRNVATTQKFSIIVSARLPVPVISRNCSSSSSSSCSLVCSVVNVNDVTLSWYAGMSVLSSISASDLSISLSLPLEVEYQDKNTYSCVLNNPISNQTTHLDINTLCRHTCAAAGLSAKAIALVCVCALAAVLCGIYRYRQHKMLKRADQDEETYKENSCSQNGAVPLLAVETDGGEMSNQKRDLRNSVFAKEDKITSVQVMEGQSVTLHTDDAEIQGMDTILWKFADYKNHDAKFVVIATLNKTNNEELPYNTNILKFKDSLKLDLNSGSLSITNITAKLCGHYKLHISREGQMSIHTFIVDPVPLNRERTICRRQTCP
ncbi:SLAM family member 5-like isoform X3 [Pimephales promelas]|uniref:SLAM family member 5-like isoform X3 n=1 Tax=Pimephales promelas TaxID=90988 RepID=UPI001955B61A|nr:SLAM family member 5-like isoform X3 [Pimephales promelas]